MAQATETSSIVIRDIETVSAIREVESLEKEVWGCDDRDIVPLTALIAIREVGGILIGAFDGPTLVGFAFGFVGREEGEIVHHSHMLAVKPTHRSHNLGYRLKLAQREHALEQGIKRMTWTFDPLQSLNAHFNFGKLGVLSDRYKVDFYGEVTSSPLHQLGTDRLWVSWLLDTPRVRERVEQNLAPHYDSDGETLIRCSDTNQPLRVAKVAEIVENAGTATIEIPDDINSIERADPNLARQWRDETRHTFSEALSAGFVVKDFFRQNGDGRTVGVYVLEEGKLDDFSGST